MDQRIIFMMKFKKIISPFLYGFLVIPNFFVLYYFFEGGGRKIINKLPEFIFSMFEYLDLVFGGEANEWIPTIFFTIIPIIIIFYLGNRLIARIEKLKLPIKADHFRQCLFLYIFSLSIFFPTYATLFILSICLTGIITNIIFLYYLQKANRIADAKIKK